MVTPPVLSRSRGLHAARAEARPAPTRRAYMKGAALTFAGGLAVACAPGGGTAAERPARSTEPVTVEVWMESPNEEFKRYWDGTLLPEWKERYPQGTVELTWPGWAELETKLITANVGGSMPQLFRMGASSCPTRRTAGWPWPWTTACVSGASAGTSSTARGTPWSGGASPGASPSSPPTGCGPTAKTWRTRWGCASATTGRGSSRPPWPARARGATRSAWSAWGPSRWTSTPTSGR